MIIVQYLDSISSIYGAFLIVALFVLFAIFGTIFLRKMIDPKRLKVHHDVAGFVFTNLGVLYGVLLGFTVINVQQRFDKINDIVEQEASYLADLYRDIEVFSEGDKREVRAALKLYAESVLNEEWELMVQQIPSENTRIALKKIWKAYYAIELTSLKQQAWYAESISKLNLLTQARLSRLLESKSSLGAEMWSLLIMGGVVMVAFMWFFGLDSLLSHLLMASILAAAMAFFLFLIYSLDTVFSGYINIPPEAINRTLLSFIQDPD